MSYLGKGSNALPNSSDHNELIEDTSLLIASVYTMLDRTQRTPQQTTSSLGRRSHNNSDSSEQLERANSNSSSPKSPKTPRLNLPTRTTLSTPSNQFCEMLERNLRTVASDEEQLIGRRLESTSPTIPRNAIERPQPVRTNRVSAPTPEEVIDLTDSMNMPVPIRRPNPFKDDVIVVTPDDGEVVDHCTPNFRRNNGRSTKTSTTNIGSANRAKVNHLSPREQAEIRSLIKKKRRLRRKWQRSRNPIDKTIANRATRELREKFTYFENKSTSDYIESLNYRNNEDHKIWNVTKYLKRPKKRNVPIKDGNNVLV
ncbi:uncharacterized protein LOC105230448 isoform X9 [Bactrocera dorsalis]|uniref:Uncharacterized protein LOC105230448 isoform X9 n=1 Tax=Bactrocera dorsalis TaxID=27457 RepID=A0ABM3J652_BACDO|nr:uncharacterized protein LOC105230448 isoform X9 [Bactrocera dorsalis]